MKRQSIDDLEPNTNRLDKTFEGWVCYPTDPENLTADNSRCSICISANAYFLFARSKSRYTSSLVKHHDSRHHHAPARQRDDPDQCYNHGKRHLLTFPGPPTDTTNQLQLDSWLGEEKGARLRREGAALVRGGGVW